MCISVHFIVVFFYIKFAMSTWYKFYSVQLSMAHFMNIQPLLNRFHSPSVLASPVSPNSIIISNGHHQVIIHTDQLVYLEGCGNYAFLYTSDGKRHLVSKTLKSYVPLLDPLSFIRVHRSWIINLSYLQDFCQYDRSLTLQGGREIMISRRRIREVANVLMPRMKW